MGVGVVVSDLSDAGLATLCNLESVDVGCKVLLSVRVVWRESGVVLCKLKDLCQVISVVVDGVISDLWDVEEAVTCVS